MSDVNVKTSPAPIQRNRFDVAMELVLLQRSMGQIGTIKDIENAFSRYYALACLCESSTLEELKSFVSEEIQSKFPRF